LKARVSLISKKNKEGEGGSRFSIAEHWGRGGEGGPLSERRVGRKRSGTSTHYKGEKGRKRQKAPSTIGPIYGYERDPGLPRGR